ncbi:MAG: DHH family phosphoesterase [Candidatus Diapherotrites archaeon]|nr:DHH family phosphoesterase [Candidatus Diapherotrites archaeon]
MDAISLLARKLGEKVRKWDDIAVVSHYDADGITSAAILVSALESIGKDVRFINVKQLYSDQIEEIKDLGSAFIFSDLGIGQISALLDSMRAPFIVLDHHEIPPGKEYPYLLHPHLFGLDGSKELSGAGVSYIFARELSGRRDLSALAVVGAVGDVQLVGGALVGYNRKILSEAIEAGKIFAFRDLALYGRVSRPLPYMFVYSTDPILPGLTANESAVYDFLDSLGIRYRDDSGHLLPYVDLTPEDRRSLFTGLSLYLLNRGWDTDKLSRLIGEVYELSDEDAHSPLRDVREYATLLNACGRHGEPEVGVHVAMGDRGKYYEEAISLLRRHREALRMGVDYVVSNGLTPLSAIQYFHAQDVIPASVVGIVAGMIYSSGIASFDKVIVGMAYEDEEHTKVSARATSRLVSAGVDLSVAMRRAAERVGGEAGGHKPAAGARIPRGREEEFVQMLDRLIATQLSST